MPYIFDFYTPQQVREIYFQGRWPKGYSEALHSMTCEVLRNKASREAIAQAEIEAIDDWTTGREDDHGFLLDTFTGMNPVRYTEAGPKPILLDESEGE